MASVSWQCPEDQLITLLRKNAATTTAAPIDVDGLFGAAELRLGGEHQETVRISRADGRS